jgi:choline dehydrogenase-like flavoprotein
MLRYVRGSNADYDDWAKLVNDEGWSHKYMTKYMRKHQTLEPIPDSVTDRSTMPYVGEHHGNEGPVRTSFNDFQLPIEANIIKGCDEVSGFDKKPSDPWSGDHIGFYNTLGTVVRNGPNKGKRSYAARGYFEANKARPNLKVLCEALVNKVVLNGTTATGVSFTHNGTTHEVKTKREVIVCGGTVQSPQILELSGIGDPNVLRAAGVECLVELPGVGNNFQDHVLTATAHQVNEGIMTLDGLYEPQVMEAATKALMEGAGGPLTCISSCQGFFPYKMMVSAEELKATVQSIKEGSTNSKFEQQQLDQIVAHLESDKSANLQLVIVPASGNFKEGVKDQSVIFPPPKDPSAPQGLTFAICLQVSCFLHDALVILSALTDLLLQYPVSRGSIHISSSGKLLFISAIGTMRLTVCSDPTKPPVIDPAYLKHPADRAVLAAGLKFCDKVAKSAAVADKFRARVFPEPSVDLQNLKEGEKAVQDWCMGEYHPCGSCAMGDVLDSKLKVKGVKGLRVADASVFPNNVSGNIVSSVYAVAEKAADIIKEEYGFATSSKAS